MKISNIIEYIEKIAPLTMAAAWDNSGMQAAARREEADHVAVCLDPTPSSIGAALDLGAQLVCSHHPLLMQPRLPHKVDAYHEVLSLLFRHDAALYAAHTSLDCNPAGPAGWLADALDLRRREVLEPTGTLPDGGIGGFGLIGDLSEPVSWSALMQLLHRLIPLDAAVVCGSAPQSVRRVAYCPGSGASLVHAASRLGADLYITGDVKYHTALEAPLCVLDVGHHSLEEEMMRRFAAFLAARMPGARIEFVASASPLRPVRAVLS